MIWRAIGKKASAAICIIFSLFMYSIDAGTCAKSNLAKTPSNTVKGQTSSSSAIPPMYLQGVKARIEHFWVLAKGVHEHASVAFRIDKNGRAYWVELTDASPLRAVNQSAQDAIFYSSPFAPLPVSCGDHLDLSVDFNSDYQPISRPGYSRATDSDLHASLRLLTSAAACSKEGKFENAIESLKKAIDLTPFDARVSDMLADAYVQSSQSKPEEQATSLLHRALLLDHRNTAVRAKLNRLLSESGLDSQSSATRVTLAREYVKSSQYDDAICEYGEAWLLKNDLQLVPEINTTCKRRKKYSDVQKWQTALKTSDQEEVHLALAQALEAFGDSDKALKEYRIVLAMDGNNISAEQAVQRLEAKGAESVNEEDTARAETVLTDEFPYADYGTRSLNVKVMKDRKVAVDYLNDACPKMITRWATNRVPLRVYVENGGGISGYRPQFRQFMIDAFAAWVKASEGRLSFSVVNYPQQANIVCHWVDDQAKASMNGNEQGITRSQYFYHKNEPNVCMVQSADIFILTIYPRNQEELTDMAIKAVCLHELGHALGISGHSPFNGDMMYATLSPYDIPQHLTERDAATIKRLYQGYDHPHGN